MRDTASSTADYQMRLIREEEMANMITEVYEREDWSYGVHDFDCAKAYDPTAIMLGEVGGEVIATIMGLKWDPTYAFITAYTVHPEHRKKGYGVKIFQKMMQNLGDRNVALFAVAGTEGIYQKSGFTPSFELCECTGVAKHRDHPLHSHISDALKVPFADLIAYDRLHFPVPREQFLQLFLRQSGTLAQVYLQEGTIQGFGVLRPGRPCAQLGPLFAANTEIATALWTSLTNTLSTGAQYQISLPMPNVHNAELKTAFGIESVESLKYMYTKTKYTLPDDCIYGCISSDLN